MPARGDVWRLACSPLRAWSHRRLGPLLLLSSLSILACQQQATVLRRNGTVEQPGRAISPEAYASFARGLLLEQRGAYRQAEAAYRGVLHIDPESGAAWAALVRLLCRDAPASARSLARRAERHADRPALPFVSLGRCLLGSDAADAAALAHEALRHEPELTSALTLLRDARLKLQGGGSEPPLFLGASKASPPSMVDTLPAVDAALEKGELEAARLHSTGFLFPGELALRAWVSGHEQLALRQTEFALLLNPTDADACLTYHLLRDEALSTETVALDSTAAKGQALDLRAEPAPCVPGDPVQALSDLGLVALAARLASTSPMAAERILAARSVKRALLKDGAARESLLYLASWHLEPHWSEALPLISPCQAPRPELCGDAALPGSAAHPEESAGESGPR